MTKAKKLLKQFRTTTVICCLTAGTTFGLGSYLCCNGYSGHDGLKDMKMPKWHDGGNMIENMFDEAPHIFSNTTANVPKHKLK